ncbi:FG-GAP repeat domain-containing protein [Streptomyces sp. NPDC087219]|uniref:FG-GAP repeat domain-containing protein n=1 Tax=Streptomyces sp. NPDC087219 TaxID=3365770 RepID=UPI00382AA3EA
MPPIRHTGTRTRSRRLTAAIAAALAVTAGSMAAAPAATATTVTPAPAATATAATAGAAATGETTQFEVTGHNITDVLDLDANGGVFPFTFTTNQKGARVSIEIYQAGSGYPEWRGSAVDRTTGDGPGSVTVEWDGNREDLVGGAHEWRGPTRNGPIEWTAHITPAGGGPSESVDLKGTSTITRKPQPHDFTDNGSPELFVMNEQGNVEVRESQYTPRTDLLGLYDMWYAPYVGWGVYDRLAVPGDLGGGNRPEIIARDKSGDLWLYSRAEGNDYDPKLNPRVRIGTNWGVYDKIVGGSDITADGKPDLIATDKSGGLWLYPGTGNLNAPLGDRKNIGTSWGVYNQIVATGNLAGAPAGDLFARDAAGVLWLYLGNGDGTFAPRIRIGAGWNEYTRIVSIGDLNRDGHPDLITYTNGDVDIPDLPYAGNGYVYWGTGDWRAPFKPRVADLIPGKDAKYVF